MCVLQPFKEEAQAAVGCCLITEKFNFLAEGTPNVCDQTIIGSIKLVTIWATTKNNEFQ